MSMMVSFVLSFFPRDVLDEILNLIESVSEDFPSYSYYISPYIYIYIIPGSNSNPRWVIKYFSAFTGIVDLLYLSLSIFILNLYQFLILCSSKVLLL